MKKFLLALAVAASAQFSAFAQTYNFTKTTGTYADLTGSNVVSAAGWDEANYDIKIGFPFTVDNMTTDSVHFDTWGDLYFTSSTDLKIVTAYEADLVDRGNSPISYQLTGTTGSRIFKIEFKNAGFKTTSGAIANEFTNFQVWLYEGSNKIEMHYGTSNVVNGLQNFGTGTGSSHGIAANIDPTSGAATGPFLTGPNANPTASTSTVAFNPQIGFWVWPSITGVPANGTIYTFSVAGTTGISKNLNNAAISVYPNPVADVVYVKGLTAKGNVTINVTDVVGKTVLTETVAAAQNLSVNVSNLKKGAYTVEIVSEEGRSIKQIIKQ